MGRKKSPVYEVAAILDEKYNSADEREFLVRWAGYSSKYDTWEPLSHLEGGADELIKKWDRKKTRLFEKQKIKKEDEDDANPPSKRQRVGSLSHGNGQRSHSRTNSSVPGVFLVATLLM